MFHNIDISIRLVSQTQSMTGWGDIILVLQPEMEKVFDQNTAQSKTYYIWLMVVVIIHKSHNTDAWRLIWNKPKSSEPYYAPNITF